MAARDVEPIGQGRYLMAGLTYVEAFNIAKTVRMNSSLLFKDGVEREAALAAVGREDSHEIADVMEQTFYRFEDHAPRWNGSIG